MRLACRSRTLGIRDVVRLQGLARILCIALACRRSWPWCGLATIGRSDTGAQQPGLAFLRSKPTPHPEASSAPDAGPKSVRLIVSPDGVHADATGQMAHHPDLWHRYSCSRTPRPLTSKGPLYARRRRSLGLALLRIWRQAHQGRPESGVDWSAPNSNRSPRVAPDIARARPNRPTSRTDPGFVRHWAPLAARSRHAGHLRGLDCADAAGCAVRQRPCTRIADSVRSISKHSVAMNQSPIGTWSAPAARSRLASRPA